MAQTLVNRKELQSLRDRLHDELLSVTKFWLKHSIDRECGGYFNGINEDGIIYDRTKYVWLQCRALWMFCRLYRSPLWKGPKYTTLRRDIYGAINHGIDFIVNKVVFHDKETNLYRCYFSVDRNGNGLTIQRKIFSECFLVRHITHFFSGFFVKEKTSCTLMMASSFPGHGVGGVLLRGLRCILCLQ